MNVVFMGTPDFAVLTLRALYEAGYTLTGVITQPDKPKGRKKVLSPCPVKEEAERLGLPVYQPARVRNPEAIKSIRDMDPDLIVVAAFGQIIPQEILDLPRYGCINVHASLLPLYRGAAPIQHAILDGRKVTGVTIMRMDAGLDTGDMIAKTEIPIDDETTGGSLFDELAEKGAELLIRTIPSIVDGTAVYTPQGETSPTPYASMIRKTDGEIDFQHDAETICLLVRAMNPWPSAYTYLDGKVLKIWRAHAKSDDGMQEGAVGTILSGTGSRMTIRTGKGLLCVDELQIEGRKRMKTEDFLRGYQIGSRVLGRTAES